MSELKRVFCDKTRLSTLLLLTVLCLALLFYSFLGGIEPDSVKNNIEGAKYAKERLGQWQELSADEVYNNALAERAELSYISSWQNGYRSEWYGFRSEEEYLSAMEKHPYFKSIEDSPADFGRAVNVYFKWLGTIEDQAKYQSSYPDYLSGIQSQAEKMTQISIFGDKNSFSGKNILKTAEEFKALDGVYIELGNNSGLELWLDFRLADYLFVGGILVIVLAFFEERKKGLWSVIRSCPNGRANLGISRLGVLALGSLVCTLLFSVLPLLLSLSLTGGSDLSRALQSLESFKTCTLGITILQWLWRYFALKIVSGIAIGLVMWVVLGCVTNPQFSLSVLCGFLALEYGLYKLLPVQSFANVLKYFNIFSYIHLSSLYTDYLNINLFGQPVGIRGLMLSVLPLLIALLILSVLLIQSKRYPEGNRDVLGSLSVKVNRVLDIFRTRLTMGGWEMYKALIFGFGAVVAIVIFILSGSLKYSVYINEPDTWYQAYLSDCEGKITAETDDYFLFAKENANGDPRLLQAIIRLESDVADTKKRAENDCFEPWIVDEKVYNSYYGSAAVDRQRLNSLIAIVFVVFLTAGIGAYERQSGVTYMVRSTKNGRTGIALRKSFTAAFMAALVWANVYLRELLTFISAAKPTTLGAAVQNLPSLAGFPLKISLGQYLVILYSERLISLILTSLIVLAISSRCKSILLSYILNMGVLALPGLLVVSGVEAMKFVSPLVPVSWAEVMWGMGDGGFGGVIAWWAVSIVGIGALAWCLIRWAEGR